MGPHTRDHALDPHQAEELAVVRPPVLALGAELFLTLLGLAHRRPLSPVFIGLSRLPLGIIRRGFWPLHF